MVLSVMSALARLKLDPSGEAFRLAKMHRIAAAIVLAKTLARLPDPPAAIDMSDTAARLIKLLPDLTRAVPPVEAATLAGQRTWGIRALSWELWLILVLSALLIYLVLTGARGADARTLPHDAPNATRVAQAVPGWSEHMSRTPPESHSPAAKPFDRLI